MCRLKVVTLQVQQSDNYYKLKQQNNDFNKI